MLIPHLWMFEWLINSDFLLKCSWPFSNLSGGCAHLQCCFHLQIIAGAFERHICQNWGWINIFLLPHHHRVFATLKIFLLYMRSFFSHFVLLYCLSHTLDVFTSMTYSALLVLSLSHRAMHTCHLLMQYRKK